MKHDPTWNGKIPVLPRDKINEALDMYCCTIYGSFELRLNISAQLLYFSQTELLNHFNKIGTSNSCVFVSNVILFRWMPSPRDFVSGIRLLLSPRRSLGATRTVGMEVWSSRARSLKTMRCYSISCNPNAARFWHEIVLLDTSSDSVSSKESSRLKTHRNVRYRKLLTWQHGVNCLRMLQTSARSLIPVSWCRSFKADASMMCMI